MSNFRLIISDYKFNLIFKIVTFLCLSFGIIYTFIEKGINCLVMYTNLSVTLVTLEYLLILILIFIKYDYHKRWVQLIRLCANSMLLMTFVVFGVILTPAAIITKTPNVFGISSIFKHFIAPAFMIFDYFVIDQEYYELKKKDFSIALSLTLLYTALIYIRGAVRTDLPSIKAGGQNARYPYFFFDPYLVGVGFEGGAVKNMRVGVVPWIIILLAVVSAIIFFSMKIKKKNSIK